MEIVCRLRVIFAEIKNKQKRFNQAEFASKVGISESQLSALVNGRSLPTLPVAYRISKELDLNVMEIWIINDET